MSTRIPPDDAGETNRTLYRYGLSLAVIFDLLVEKGIVTREEIQRHAQTLNQALWFDERVDPPSDADLLK